MTWPETLRTDRLVLRPPVESDASAIFDAYARDPDVTRYMDWRPHASIADTEAWLLEARAGWRDGTELTWMLTRRFDGRIVGAIALRPRGHMANIGYVLARELWGQGLVAEAGQALMDEAAAHAELHRVWATCDVENHASARVMEKIGMTFEGTLRRWVLHPNVSPIPRDALCYAWVRPLASERP